MASSAPKRLILESYDRTRLEAYEFKNPGAKRWMIYFPGLAYGYDGRWFPARLVEELLSLGNNLLVVNIRGHLGSRGEFSFVDHCKDIIHVVNEHAKKHPEPLVFGHSISATALLAVSEKLPKDATLLVHAPVRRADRNFSHRTEAAINAEPIKFRGTFFRLMLLFSNLKSGYWRYTGFRNIMNDFGACRISDRERFWEFLTGFSFSFPKVRQRGIILYGERDPFQDETFPRAAKRTGLPVVKLKGAAHNVRSFWRKDEDRYREQLIRNIRNYLETTLPSSGDDA